MEYGTDIDTIYNNLLGYIIELNEHFMRKHLLNPLATPDEYDLDVKSYCVLSHAALEECAENIVSKVMAYSFEEFLRYKRVNFSLLTLIHFKSSFDEGLLFGKIDDKLPLMTLYDYIRKTNDKISSSFSSDIHNNHGVSVKYLKNLFLPVGIDIPNDENLLNSLSMVANERGAYAHKFTERGGVKRSINPEQADIYIYDCLDLFGKLVTSAKAV